MLRGVHLTIGLGPQQLIEQGSHIAVFGSFSYRAVSTGRRFDSDYAIRIQLQGDRIAEYHFFENSYAVAAAFRTSGAWTLMTSDGGANVPTGDP